MGTTLLLTRRSVFRFDSLQTTTTNHLYIRRRFKSRYFVRCTTSIHFKLSTLLQAASMRGYRYGLTQASVLYVCGDNRHSLTVVRESRKFSRHPYIGRIARSSLRQHSFLVFTMAITFVSMSEFNLLKCSHFLNSFQLLGNRKTYTYLYGYCVCNQLQNENHRCQCKQTHKYFRITRALCHLTAV